MANTFSRCRRGGGGDVSLRGDGRVEGGPRGSSPLPILGMLQEWPVFVGSEEVVVPVQGVGQQQEVMAASAPPRPCD